MGAFCILYLESINLVVYRVNQNPSALLHFGNTLSNQRLIRTRCLARTTWVAKNSKSLGANGTNDIVKYEIMACSAIVDGNLDVHEPPKVDAKFVEFFLVVPVKGLKNIWISPCEISTITNENEGVDVKVSCFDVSKVATKGDIHLKRQKLVASHFKEQLVLLVCVVFSLVAEQLNAAEFHDLFEELLSRTRTKVDVEIFGALLVDAKVTNIATVDLATKPHHKLCDFVHHLERVALLDDVNALVIDILRCERNAVVENRVSAKVFEHHHLE